jgi:hypothetical protein
MCRTCLLIFILMVSVGVFAQNPISADSVFQIHYAANLNLNDSVIDITNSGARGGVSLTGPGSGGTGASEGGAICVNAYVFSPDEQEVACCSCPVTPNGLVSWSVKSDLVSNPLTPAVPTSVVVKLLASVPVGGSCNNSAAGAATETLAPGMEAWMTTTHVITTVKPATFPGQKPTTTLTPVLTETSFTPSTLSAGELASIAGRCSDIVGNGSGFGICHSCRIGGQ